jgi:succinate dehydrogenase / fumarate reductase cytochrome b subunit
MNRLVRLFGASIGRKLVTAGTGVILLGYLFGHMYGNMHVFQGPESLNSYAAWLKGHPLLWVFRVGLLTVFALHIFMTLTLARDNRAARPLAYERYRPHSSSTASRSMLLTGLVVLSFVVYHLLHFTFGLIDAQNMHMADAQGRLDVYSMVVRSFRNPWISGSYVVAMVLLGIHLWHGTVSAFQTFGVHHESYQTLIRVSCMVLVAGLVVGNCSIPVLIYLGVVPLAAGSAP